MRVKSNWFKSGQEKTPQQNAGAMAFIVWRIGRNMLGNMRRADFEIAVGPQYFGYLAEFLIFLTQVADRIAYRSLDAEQRAAFTTELALKLAQVYAENRSELLGTDLAASRRDFIDRLNDRADGYAECGYDQDGPDFAFMRFLAHCLLEICDERDRSWVTDQVMAIEAPEAVRTAQRAMAGLFAAGERRARRTGGVSGD